MSDILNTTFEEIRWVISGLLPEGLAILSGPPKIGKSWLVMNLCIATATGGIALGKFQVDVGEVLLMSLEDNERRLKSRSQISLDDETTDLSLLHTTTTWPRLDDGGMKELKKWFQDHPACKLVVIDTMQKIKAPPKKGANAYENDYETYGDLQRLALEAHCCILVIHHNRKSSPRNDDDPLEQISGSTGITGVMDTVMMLRRPRGAANAVLTATGRDIADAEYGMVFNGECGQWTVTGPAEGVAVGGNSHEILQLLRDRQGQLFKLQEVFELLEARIPLNSLKTQLYRLAKRGAITAYKGTFLCGKTVTCVTDVTGSNPVTAVSPNIEGVTGNGSNSVTPPFERSQISFDRGVFHPGTEKLPLNCD